MLNTERRSGMLSAELEEVRTSLEQSDRSRRLAQSDHAEAMERLSELQSSTTGFAATKRKLEADIMAMQSDLEESANEVSAWRFFPSRPTVTQLRKLHRKINNAVAQRYLF